VPVEAGGGECVVEGCAMQFLGFGQGAVYVKNQRS
jgi:hypothetical protein